jgi:alpha-tubulin suppressor-like RCC1 family protein
MITACVKLGLGLGLIADGRIKCWGLNDKGQLGIGSNQTIGLAASDMGDYVGC